MEFPVLKFVNRNREYLNYKDQAKAQVIYEHLFNGRSRRWLDEQVLKLDPEYSKGWQSFGILNFVGLTNAHKGIFKGKTLREALEYLMETGDESYTLIIEALQRLEKAGQTNDIHGMFATPEGSRALLKQVGTSQFTDGVRIDKEFHEYFNPVNAEYFTERGQARPIKILFNNKVFVAEYRFEDQSDKSIILQSIRFRKDLKEEFKRVFPSPDGEFIIQQGSDLNHFVFNHLVNSSVEAEDDGTGYPEGRVAYRKHRVIERNAKVIKAAKEIFSSKNKGRIFCEACKFDFAKTYGARGSGFIEGHHKKPVSEMVEGEETRVEDIVLLCANCHRMVHRKPFVTIVQFSKMLQGE